MVRKLMIGLLLISPLANAQVTVKQTMRVMIKITRLAKVYPHFYIEPSARVGANTSRFGVVVTSSMMKFLNSEDELATVLGHEVSHFRNRDYKERVRYKMMQNELHADKVGYRWCLKAGYGKCLVAPMRMLVAFGEGDGDGIHPKWSYRIKMMQK